MAGTLYRKIGGKAAIDAAVDIFYQKFLADESLAPFFEGVQMDKQSGSLKVFLSMAFGGTAKYKGPGLREAHAKMVENGLNDNHFNAVVQHLGATLQKLGVDGELIQEAAAIAESVRGEILGGPLEKEENTEWAEGLEESAPSQDEEPQGPIAPPGWDIVKTCEHCNTYAILRGPEGY